MDISYRGPVVAFDLDDTLFHERDFCRSGFRFLCDPNQYKIAGITSYPSHEELGELIDRMEEELVARKNPFKPFEDFFSPLVDSGCWDLQKHIDAYRSHHPKELIFADGMKEVLQTFADRGIRMALITDGRSVTQRSKIEALDLRRYIPPEMILISEETGHEKLQSKEMFAAVVRNFPEAKSFFYVGNNPLKDFYFPNLLGWTTIQVPPHQDDVHRALQAPTPLHAPKILLDSVTFLLNMFS